MPLAEPAVCDNGTLSELSKMLSRAFQRRVVAVESQDSQPCIPREQGGTVSTKAAGTVHDKRARWQGPEGPHNRCDKDGKVFGHGGFKQPPPGESSRACPPS